MLTEGIDHLTRLTADLDRLSGAWLFTYIDPDDVGHEVLGTHPGCWPADCLPRAEWTTVPMASAAVSTAGRV